MPRHEKASPAAWAIDRSAALSRRWDRPTSGKPAPWRRLLAACATVLIGLAALTGVPLSAQVLAIPATGAYTGAYMDFGETEDTVTPKAITRFAQLVGKHQAIVASSSFWGVGTFPAANAQTISSAGAVPLLYWSPWGPPYEQGSDIELGDFSLPHIVSGDCDAYIDKWAAGARAYGKPLLVSFACEMNSDWYPWSGWRNGAARPAAAGQGYAGPELYKSAWRHVVARVRAAGVHNISWVFQPNNTSHPDRKWNTIAQYYPGSAYVDWLSLSAYGELTPDDDWTDWDEAMNEPYEALCAVDAAKPVMLAEWGVGEFPKNGSKADFIRTAFREMNGGKYPRLKAAVFWHERWQNSDETYSNLRVQSSPGALQEYRQGLAHSFWLEKPEFTSAAAR